ncbi:MAG: VIT domain-containing protein, partial [Planctomycetota bacterium]
MRLPASVRRLSASVALVTVATCACAELIMDPGVTARPVPLGSQTVRAHISGIVARVTVTQRYKVIGSQRAAEAVFRFPLPHDSSVHEFRM